ncbi:unnamed protein product [Amoebophrya sp. A120]|nr:unnamed protein product [Amoebophrya sp. A120]|eukprot:GSA120T00008296001.1
MAGTGGLGNSAFDSRNSENNKVPDISVVPRNQRRHQQHARGKKHATFDPHPEAQSPHAFRKRKREEEALLRAARTSQADYNKSSSTEQASALLLSAEKNYEEGSGAGASIVAGTTSTSTGENRRNSVSSSTTASSTPVVLLNSSSVPAAKYSTTTSDLAIHQNPFYAKREARGERAMDIIVPDISGKARFPPPPPANEKNRGQPPPPRQASEGEKGPASTEIEIGHQEGGSSLPPGGDQRASISSAETMGEVLTNEEMLQSFANFTRNRQLQQEFEKTKQAGMITSSTQEQVDKNTGMVVNNTSSTGEDNVTSREGGDQGQEQDSRSKSKDSTNPATTSNTVVSKHQKKDDLVQPNSKGSKDHAEQENNRSPASTSPNVAAAGTEVSAAEQKIRDDIALRKDHKKQFDNAGSVVLPATTATQQESAVHKNGKEKVDKGSSHVEHNKEQKKLHKDHDVSVAPPRMKEKEVEKDKHGSTTPRSGGTRSESRQRIQQEADELLRSYEKQKSSLQRELDRMSDERSRKSVLEEDGGAKNLTNSTRRGHHKFSRSGRDDHGSSTSVDREKHQDQRWVRHMDSIHSELDERDKNQAKLLRNASGKRGHDHRHDKHRKGADQDYSSGSDGRSRRAGQPRRVDLTRGRSKEELLRRIEQLERGKGKTLVRGRSRSPPPAGGINRAELRERNNNNSDQARGQETSSSDDLLKRIEQLERDHAAATAAERASSSRGEQQHLGGKATTTALGKSYAPPSTRNSAGAGDAPPSGTSGNKMKNELPNDHTPVTFDVQLTDDTADPTSVPGLLQDRKHKPVSAASIGSALVRPPDLSNPQRSSKRRHNIVSVDSKIMQLDSERALTMRAAVTAAMAFRSVYNDGKATRERINKALAAGRERNNGVGENKRPSRNGNNKASVPTSSTPGGVVVPEKNKIVDTSEVFKDVPAAEALLRKSRALLAKVEASEREILGLSTTGGEQVNNNTNSSMALLPAGTSSGGVDNFRNLVPGSEKENHASTSPASAAAEQELPPGGGPGAAIVDLPLPTFDEIDAEAKVTAALLLSSTTTSPRTASPEPAKLADLVAEGETLLHEDLERAHIDESEEGKMNLERASQASTTSAFLRRKERTSTALKPMRQLSIPEGEWLPRNLNKVQGVVLGDQEIAAATAEDLEQAVRAMGSGISIGSSASTGKNGAATQGPPLQKLQQLLALLDQEESGTPSSGAVLLSGNNNKRSSNKFTGEDDDDAYDDSENDEDMDNNMLGQDVVIAVTLLQRLARLGNGSVEAMSDILDGLERDQNVSGLTGVDIFWEHEHMVARILREHELARPAFGDAYHSPFDPLSPSLRSLGARSS